MKALSAAVFAVLALYLSTGTATEITLKNPGFEDSAAKATGWTMLQHAGKTAYATAIDEEVFSAGKRSFRMKRTTEQVYGLLRQIVNAPDSAGKTLRISAMMKTEKVGTKGWGLVVNFLTARGGTIVLQTRSSAVSGDSDWTPVVLEKKIPKRTGKLEVGVMLLDDGTGWVDEVKVEILDAETTPETESKPTETTVDKKRRMLPF